MHHGYKIGIQQEAACQRLSMAWRKDALSTDLQCGNASLMLGHQHVPHSLVLNMAWVDIFETPDVLLLPTKFVTIIFVEDFQGKLPSQYLCNALPPFAGFYDKVVNTESYL